MAKGTGEDDKSSRTGPNTRVIGGITWLMGEEGWCMQTETAMRGKTLI
jgi:hypothetical protein